MIMTVTSAQRTANQQPKNSRIVVGADADLRKHFSTAFKLEGYVKRSRVINRESFSNPEKNAVIEVYYA